MDLGTWLPTPVKVRAKAGRAETKPTLGPVRVPGGEPVRTRDVWEEKMDRLKSPRPKARGPSRLKMEVSERKLFRNRRSFNLKSKNERWPFLHALDKILRTWGESDLTS